MKHYRMKKKINDHGNLINHLKKNKFIAEKVVDELAVSSADIN